MTLNDGFERTVSDWLDEQAGRGAPGYLDEVLARTTRTRQRPAWSSLERWLPVNITVRRSLFNQPVQVGQIALLLIIGLLIAAFVAIAVGIRRSPAPYGLAENGAIVSSRDGDIYAIDPATLAATPGRDWRRLRLRADLFARRDRVPVHALGRPDAGRWTADAQPHGRQC